MNLKGISHEESLITPEPGGNCINWIVGHIVASRNHLLELVFEDPILLVEDTAQYERGEKVSDVKTLLPLSNLKSAFKISQEKLKNALLKLTDDDLNRTIDKDKEKDNTSLARIINFLHFHEAYHLLHQNLHLGKVRFLLLYNML